MHNLNNLLEECKKELEAIGIKPGPVLAIVPWYNVRTWGLCTKVTKEFYEIKINALLLADDAPIDGAKKVVMHELLHTCPGCMRHTGKWKQYAARVNARYGYNIKRGDNAKELGVDPEKQKPKKQTIVHYTFRCQKCGKLVERKRKSKFTEHPENYRCAYCGGNFAEI